MKHSPFESSYLQDFVILEERQGPFTRFPRSEQLPLLARALKAEFEGMLPHRLARVDERASDFHKLERKVAVEGFCYMINSSRPDGLLLLPLLDRDRVAQVAVVQQVTEERPKGLRHWFKYYVNARFFTEILFCGRRMIFSDHAVERFSTRAPGLTADTLKNILIDCVESPHLVFTHGKGLALFPAGAESVIALPYNEGEGELFIATCLSVNEINTFPDAILPIVSLNPHYGTMFKLPRTRTWIPGEAALELRRLWEQKVKARPGRLERAGKRWGDLAARIPDIAAEFGYRPGCRLIFVDHIPGPACQVLDPGEEEPQYDEWEDYKRIAPDVDWEEEFKERDKRMTITEETRPKAWPEF